MGVFCVLTGVYRSSLSQTFDNRAPIRLPTCCCRFPWLSKDRTTRCARVLTNKSAATHVNKITTRCVARRCVFCKSFGAQPSGFCVVHQRVLAQGLRTQTSLFVYAYLQSTFDVFSSCPSYRGRVASRSLGLIITRTVSSSPTLGFAYKQKSSATLPSTLVSFRRITFHCFKALTAVFDFERRNDHNYSDADKCGTPWRYW